MGDIKRRVERLERAREAQDGETRYVVLWANEIVTVRDGPDAGETMQLSEFYRRYPDGNVTFFRVVYDDTGEPVEYGEPFGVGPHIQLSWSGRDPENV